LLLVPLVLLLTLLLLAVLLLLATSEGLDEPLLVLGPGRVLTLLLLLLSRLGRVKAAAAGSATDGMNAGVPNALCTWHTASAAAHGCMPCMTGSSGTHCLLLELCNQLLHLLLLVLKLPKPSLSEVVVQ
jgi:hypothetical protein